MLMNIILYASSYIIVPIMCACLLMAVKSKKNLILGVKIPEEHLTDADILKEIKKYKKEIWILTAVLAIFPIPACFIKGFTISMSVWMLWLVASIIGYAYPYIKYHKKIKEIKVIRQWGIPQTIREVLVDTKTIVEKEKYRYHLWFIGAILLSVIPACISLVKGFLTKDQDLFLGQTIGVASVASVSLMLYLVSIWLLRLKSEIISMDSNINANFNRAKNRLWNHFLIVMAYVNAAYTCVMLISIDEDSVNAVVLIVATCIFTIAAIVYGFVIQQKTMNLRLKLMLEAPECDSSEDEEHWIYGLFYYNPDDKHLMVEKRLGIGTTVNMATKTGKAILIFTLLSLLSLPGICVLIGLDEYTPISYKYENQQLTVSHVLTEYSIAEENIAQISVITELPKRNRINGTGMITLEKGIFKVDGYGKCRLCLNPQNEFFVVITTKDGLNYIFSADKDADTRILYEYLK